MSNHELHRRQLPRLGKASILGAVAAIALLFSAGAAAAHGFVGFGINLGVPLYAPPPVYYPPPAVVYAPPAYTYAPAPYPYYPYGYYAPRYAYAAPFGGAVQLNFGRGWGWDRGWGRHWR